ncbi:hypothetical protein BD324DRAFT_636945 [Kockovaella imperatae]|uniref:Integral membrane protein n=1 Tax=Kockovaella imperatae TaxID=4999 RepID=A0A1Y1U838_9TREE|nr:hypothetical protein BD324DRAFT_636945 [Kockovaella imperatae]ORX34178.1 hypothetical protein BD324DRAFT_636945 [Kockovaella imperatae]
MRLLRGRPLASLSLGILCLSLLILAPLTSASIFTDSVLSYCKCICFTNSTIIPLYLPADPSKPCLSCTKQFCLDQKLAICKGASAPELDEDTMTGTEGDVEARCFKRDSPRDKLIVTFFIIIVFGMLVFAGIRARLRKAIDKRGKPADLREWSEALMPEPLRPITASFFDRVPGLPGDRRREGGYPGEMRQQSGQGYAPVSVGS